MKTIQAHPSPDNLPSGIGSPAHRALTTAGITKLEQFTTVSEKELLNLHGVGPKVVRIIKEALRDNGLSFARDEDSRRISDKANQKIERRAGK